MESFHLLYCLGYHIVKVSNFPKAAAAIRTDEGRPRGALLLAVLAVRIITIIHHFADFHALCSAIGHSKVTRMVVVSFLNIPTNSQK